MIKSARSYLDFQKRLAVYTERQAEVDRLRSRNTKAAIAVERNGLDLRLNDRINSCEESIKRLKESSRFVRIIAKLGF